MWITGWIGQGVAMGIALLAGILYLRGWRHVRRIWPTLATPWRLAAFGLGLLLFTAAHFAPLYALSNQLLAARAIQKILAAMLGPILLWLSCPFHLLLWGCPAPWRRHVTAYVLRTSTTQDWLRALTNPGITWLLFISSFCIGILSK
jgi:putative membrane protein